MQANRKRNCYRVDMSVKSCLVFLPKVRQIQVSASSSMEAAAKALAIHGQPIADDVVVRVVLEGKSFVCWDAHEHNAQQPNFRHTVASVRAWEKRMPQDVNRG